MQNKFFLSSMKCFELVNAGGEIMDYFFIDGRLKIRLDLFPFNIDALDHSFHIE
jgi:hypothetical protein